MKVLENFGNRRCSERSFALSFILIFFLNVEGLH